MICAYTSSAVLRGCLVTDGSAEFTGAVIIGTPPIIPSYYDGLGGGYYYENSIPFVYRYNTLVYYHKGMEVWGNPLTLPCTGGNRVNQLGTSTSSINVYPNPCKDYLFFGNIYNEMTSGEITIFTETGNIVLFQSISMSNNYMVDMSTLKEGLYFIRYFTDSGINNSKIIKINQ